MQHCEKQSLPKNPCIKKSSTKLFNDPAKHALEKYKNHQSITSIKNKTASIDNSKFSLSFVCLNKTLDGINKLKH